jgi:hypothetical protein
LKTSKLGSCRLSKSASWLWPAFKTGEMPLAAFQNRRVGSSRLSKPAKSLWPASTQLREICYPIGAKDLNLSVLKSFSQIQKIFAPNGKDFINSI